MDIQELTKKMHQFVRHQGWYQKTSSRPQTPKNLAASLAVECGEILELFQWQEEAVSEKELASELADVTLYLLQLASVSGIDLEQAVLDKLQTNYQRRWDQDPLSGGKEGEDD